jgi:tRNA dimethylallyltransferase
MQQKIVVINGPTASGKSALSLMLAGKFNGVIINADSMQIYKEIPIITAQPTNLEQQLVEHQLYGLLTATDLCSAGLYIRLAKEKITKAWDSGKVPILVGGTGLYIKSLIYGIAKVPDIEDALRYEVRALYEEIGAEEFYQLLTNADPVAAAKLNRLDKQRVIRAYEVIKQTNVSINTWQQKLEPSGFDKEQFIQIGLLPARDKLYQQCNDRFLTMVENGLLAEIKALNELTMDNNLPVRKAHGVPEITAYLNGEITLEAAIKKSQQITRNYAKRQFTWLKHQMPDMVKLQYEDIDHAYKQAEQIISSNL